MRRLFAGLLFLATLLSGAPAGAQGFNGGGFNVGLGPFSGGGGGCSPGTHATAYLNDFGGTFNSTYQDAFCNLINGLDSNSLYSKFDTLYILGNQSSTDALIPVTFGTATASASFSNGATTISIGSCPSVAPSSASKLQIWDKQLGQQITSASNDVTGCSAGNVTINGGVNHASSGSADTLYFYYAPVLNGSPTFAANGGYTGVDGGTSNSTYIDLGYKPSTAGNCTQNNCAAWIWLNTQVTSSASGGACMGITSGSTGTRFFPSYNAASNSTYMDILVNAVSVDYAAGNTIGKGHFLANRSSSSAAQYYVNGSQVATTTTSTSAAAPNQSVVALATINNTGTINTACGNQIAAWGWGSQLSSTDVTNLFNLLDAFGAAVGWGYH